MRWKRRTAAWVSRPKVPVGVTFRAPAAASLRCSRVTAALRVRGRVRCSTGALPLDGRGRATGRARRFRRRGGPAADEPGADQGRAPQPRPGAVAEPAVDPQAVQALEPAHGERGRAVVAPGRVVREHAHVAQQQLGVEHVGPAHPRSRELAGSGSRRRRRPARARPAAAGGGGEGGERDQDQRERGRSAHALPPSRARHPLLPLV